MYRIGDFSRLCQVSVKTLHHWDDFGLLRPARVDEDNGYRFYSAEQVGRVRRILNLKGLGFSLEEIAGVIDGGDLPEGMKALLLERKRELMRLLGETGERIAKVDILLAKIEKEESMPRLDVIVKKIEPQLVASMRERVTSLERLGAMFSEVAEHVERSGGKITGPGTFVHHDSEFQDGGSDMETVFAIASEIPGTESVRVYELPGVESMACLIYQGAHDEASEEARQALASWIEEHGYRISGPDRLAFLFCDEPGESEKSVVEFQYPVEKAV